MSALNRFFKVISYDKLNQTADMLLAANQEQANEIRKNGLNEIMLLIGSNDVDKLKEAMQRNQNALNKLAAVDKAILELVSKTKE